MEKSWNIFMVYVNLMNDFLIYYTSKIHISKFENDYIFLLQNGLSTLTHIFKISLREYIDLNKTIELTKIAIIYYTEFIDQIEENSIYDLNISSSIASIFVYKKTINNIIPNEKIIDDIIKIKIKNFDHLIIIYRDLFEILTKHEYVDDIPEKLLNAAVGVCDITYIQKKVLITTSEISDELKNNEIEIIFNQTLTYIMFFINHFSDEELLKYKSNYTIFNYIETYIKKYKHIPLTIEIIYNKKINKHYHKKRYNDSIDNYIKWLIL